MDKTHDTTTKPFITEAGPVMRYLFSEAQADPHGLAFVRSYPDDIRAFLRNVREYDDAGPAKSTIRTYDDALASLEDDIKKFPELNLESIIEYSDNPLACQQNDDYLIVSYSPLVEAFREPAPKPVRTQQVSFDWTNFSARDYQDLRETLRDMAQDYKQAGGEGAECLGYVCAGDVCIDIEAVPERAGTADGADVVFSPYVPDTSDNEESAVYSGLYEPFPYKEIDSDLGLGQDMIGRDVMRGMDYPTFKGWLESHVTSKAEEAVQSRLARHLKSRKKFWQIKTATENRPDCEFRAPSGYDDLEIIPQHFHDDTPKDAIYPVITDDQKTFSIEEDALHGTAAKQGSRYRLRLKDTGLDCQPLAGLRAATNKQGAVAASNNFEHVLKTFHELHPKVLQSRERMEHIMADSPANEFSRAYREGYLDSEQGENAHDQACQYAVEHCLRHGATEQQVMLFVEKQAPMSVWEDTSVYAMRILREARQDLASRGLKQFTHENREGHRR